MIIFFFFCYLYTEFPREDMHMFNKMEGLVQRLFPITNYNQ